MVIRINRLSMLKSEESHLIPKLVEAIGSGIDDNSVKTKLKIEWSDAPECYDVEFSLYGIDQTIIIDDDDIIINEIRIPMKRVWYDRIEVL